MDESNVNPRKLYVGNLNYDTTEEQLRELFSTIGTVEEVNVIPDRFNNRPNKGYSFVVMGTEEEAKEAVDKLNETEQWGRTIIVNVARPKKERSDFNRG